MTALVRGLALGVTPDEPEPERYLRGQRVVCGTRRGDIDVVVIQHHEDGGVEISTPGGEVGWTVHERDLSPRPDCSGTVCTRCGVRFPWHSADCVLGPAVAVHRPDPWWPFPDPPPADDRTGRTGK